MTTSDLSQRIATAERLGETNVVLGLEEARAIALAISSEPTPDLERRLRKVANDLRFGPGCQHGTALVLENIAGELALAISSARAAGREWKPSDKQRKDVEVAIGHVLLATQHQANKGEWPLAKWIISSIADYVFRALASQPSTSDSFSDGRMAKALAAPKSPHVDCSEPVTTEQVRAIDNLVREDMSQGDWTHVEGEASPPSPELRKGDEPK